MNSIRIISLFLLIVAGTTSSLQIYNCPFRYLYRLGDGVDDIGNSIRILPWGPYLPAAHPPYGRTNPGWPTGRWSDGYVEFDLNAAIWGLPNIKPSLGGNLTRTDDGVMFCVTGSPVLDREFFEERGIDIAPYAVPLSGQMRWFKDYLKSMSSEPTDIAERLASSVILFGDLVANDIAYALLQGKSIQEVKTYVEHIIAAQISATRELLRRGATRIILPSSAPIGCYPFILTALASDDPSSYDDLGCLREVNEFIQLKNNQLNQSVTNLAREFPNVMLSFGDYYGGVMQAIKNQSLKLDPDEYPTLKACCGIGGKYNFDSKRFCGSPEVQVCTDPGKYIFWDGRHLTQDTNLRVMLDLVDPFTRSLNCTLQSTRSLNCTPQSTRSLNCTPRSLNCTPQSTVETL